MRRGLGQLFSLSAGGLPDRPPFDPKPSVGAIVTFDGLVRNVNDGKEVQRLEYSAYAVLAEREGARIVQAAIDRYGLMDAACVHRTGELVIGESAVRVWAAAAHRGEAFAACRYIIDTLKQTVPIWKKEFFEDGEVWVGSTP